MYFETSPDLTSTVIISMKEQTTNIPETIGKLIEDENSYHSYVK